MNIETAKILKGLSYTNVFVTDPPETLDDYILVSSSGGFGVDVTDAGFARGSVQIIVANKSYIDMKDTIKAITRDLLSLSDVDIKSIDIALEAIGYTLESDTLELGKDEQVRYLNSANFTVMHNID